MSEELELLYSMSGPVKVVTGTGFLSAFSLEELIQFRLIIRKNGKIIFRV